MEDLNAGTLSPRINEHKDIISSNTKHNEDDKVVKVSIKGDSEQSLMENCRKTKGQKYQKNTNACKEEGSEMENKVGQDKHHRGCRE